MPIDPKDFFLEYVLEPYDAWINQELCKWKAMAVANGLNALMEVKFLHDNPTRTVRDSDHDQALGTFRRGLTNWEDHRHIRFVTETFKHVERRKKTEIPGKLGDMKINQAGPFGEEFDEYSTRCGTSSAFHIRRRREVLVFGCHFGRLPRAASTTGEESCEGQGSPMSGAPDLLPAPARAHSLLGRRLRLGGDDIRSVYCGGSA